MKSNITDANSPDENIEYDEYLGADEETKYDNLDSVSIKNTTDNTVNCNHATDSKSKGENVAEKVDGVTLSNSYHTNEIRLKSGLSSSPADDSSLKASANVEPKANNVNASGSDDWPDARDLSKLDSEDIVRQLESQVGEKLGVRRRKVVKLIASINLGRGIGGTRKDLEKMGIGKDNAEKILRELREGGFLIPHHKKTRRMPQYVLPNLFHLMNSAVDEKEATGDPLQYDIKLILAAELGLLSYRYHNIGIQTSLNYNEDYKQLDWNIKSPYNKQKVERFKLDSIRSCTFKVSPTLTVEIDIECTQKPYSFHTSRGLMDFIADCGEIRGILKQVFNNRMEVVPRIDEWFLTHFDYNKDLSSRHLQDKYPTEMMSWTGKGLLRLKYLGTLFQIYQKPMPFIGECLRIEGHKKIRGGVKMSEMLERIIKAESDNTEVTHPFVTLEEMLLSGRAKVIDD